MLEAEGEDGRCWCGSARLSLTCWVDLGCFWYFVRRTISKLMNWAVFKSHTSRTCLNMSKLYSHWIWACSQFSTDTSGPRLCLLFTASFEPTRRTWFPSFLSPRWACNAATAQICSWFSGLQTWSCREPRHGHSALFRQVIYVLILGSFYEAVVPHNSFWQRGMQSFSTLFVLSNLAYLDKQHIHTYKSTKNRCFLTVTFAVLCVQLLNAVRGSTWSFPIRYRFNRFVHGFAAVVYFLGAHICIGRWVFQTQECFSAAIRHQCGNG